MITRRIVLTAVLAFVLAWGTLTTLAMQRTRHSGATRGPVHGDHRAPRGA